MGFEIRTPFHTYLRHKLMVAARRFLVLPSFVFGLSAVSSAGGFPVESLTVSPATFARLNTTALGRDALATSTLLPVLQSFFRQVAYQIEVEQGDVILSASFPDEQIDDNCHHKIEAEHPKATGTIEKSSFLRFGAANISWHGATVFLDGQLDAKLDISTDVCVRVGKKIFGHHCSQVARKTVGIDVLSDGQTGIGINMTAYNAHIAKVNGTWSLVFNFHAAVVGTVLKWNVEKVTADNCKIKIIGITVGSVCGTIERHVKDVAQKLTDHITQVSAPKILKKLEAKINTAIGSEVVIPLKLGVSEAPSTEFEVIV